MLHGLCGGGSSVNLCVLKFSQLRNPQKVHVPACLKEQGQRGGWAKARQHWLCLRMRLSLAAFRPLLGSLAPQQERGQAEHSFCPESPEDGGEGHVMAWCLPPGEGVRVTEDPDLPLTGVLLPNASRCTASLGFFLLQLDCALFCFCYSKTRAGAKMVWGNTCALHLWQH